MRNGPISVHTVYSYQTAKLEQARRTATMIIESGSVSMGTGASFCPQVFVIVNCVKTLIILRPGTFLVPLSLFSQRFNEVCLVLKAHKATVDEMHLIFT